MLSFWYHAEITFVHRNTIGSCVLLVRSAKTTHLCPRVSRRVPLVFSTTPRLSYMPWSFSFGVRVTSICYCANTQAITQTILGYSVRRNFFGKTVQLSDMLKEKFQRKAFILLNMYRYVWCLNDFIYQYVYQ